MKGKAELKVPEGKLVRADVSFDDEIEDVELHGDFFVYPEEALDVVEEALEGESVGTDTERLSELVENSLGPGARLVGFGPENVAQIVMEAMDDAQ